MGSMLMFFQVIPETKKLLIHLFVITYLPDILKQLLRAALEKGSCYLGLIFEKHLLRAHILLKLQASSPQIFQKEHHNRYFSRI